jgi:uncharacterized protein YndB with AHSA1/START domain
LRTTELSILINHPAAEVFHFATDPTHLSEWILGENQTLTVAEGPLEVGFSFTLNQGDENRRRQFIYNVIDLQSPTSFGVKTEGRILTYSSRLLFKEENGKTRVTDIIEMEDPPGMLNLLGGFVLGQLKKSHQNNLERLKSAVGNYSPG